MKKYSYLLMATMLLSQPVIGAAETMQQLSSDEQVSGASTTATGENDVAEMNTETSLVGQEVTTDSTINEEVVQEENTGESFQSAQNTLKLTSDSPEVLAGRSAIFNIYLNITEPIQMKDTTVTIDLPTGFELGSSLEELTIADVTPSYENDQLVYHFVDLKEGLSLNKKLYIKTSNGTTVDGTKLSLKGTYQSGENTPQIETAETIIKSTAAFSVTNKFTQTVGDDKGVSVPSPNDDAIWEFHANLPISEEGSQFIKEGTKIKYSVMIDEGLTYQSMVDSNVPEPTITEGSRVVSVTGQPDKEIKCQILTWEIDAPSYEEQAQDVNSLGGQDLSMILHVEKEVKVFTNLQVSAEANATFIGGDFKTAEKLATIMVGPNDEFGPENSMGTAYTPAHYGAADGSGNVSSGSQNADPDVYAGDQLSWRVKYSGGLDIQQTVADKFRFKRYEFEYDIDPKLDFTGITMQPNYFMPNSGVPAWTPIQEEPKFDVYVKYVGDDDYQSTPILENIQTNKKHTAAEIGIDSSKQVASIKLHASDAPVGLYGSAVIHTKAKSGENGKIINHARQRIQGFVFNQGAIKDYTYSEDGIWDNDDQKWNNNSNAWKPFMAAKTANLIERPTGKEKVVTSSIALKDVEENKTVVSGENEVMVKIASDKASISDIEGPLVSYVALPKGITLDETKLAEMSADISIVDDNFQNLEKQLIQINWQEGSLTPNATIAQSLPVTIETGDTTKSLGFEHYLTLPDNKNVNVPDVSEEGMTVKEPDSEDINNNGDTDEFIFRSSNLYFAVKNEAVAISTEVVNNASVKATEGLVTTEAGKPVKVNLNLHKFSSKVFDKITLIGTIPTIGDSTITTAEARESEIDTFLMDALELPNEWHGKVAVYYSETANPNVVGDLDKQTDYKEFDPISNPKDGEDAEWIAESDVTDFSKMKSFKIVSNDLEGNWVAGSDKTIGVNLSTDVVENTTESDLEELAFVTGAVAINHLVPTESTRAGFRVITKAEPIEPTEPSETEPSETEPSETEPSETEPSETESSETEPSETESSETESSETESSETESSETESSETDGTEPTGPIDPTEPTEPTEPPTSQKPSPGNQSDDKDNLPQTGEAVQKNLIIAGLSLIIVLLGVLTYRRFNKREK